MKIVPNNTYVQTQDSSETALAEQDKGYKIKNNPLQCDRCIVEVASQLRIEDSRNEVEGGIYSIGKPNLVKQLNRHSRHKLNRWE